VTYQQRSKRQTGNVMFIRTFVSSSCYRVSCFVAD